MKTALMIDGSDSLGGAVIQADIKTATANNVFGMSAVTALIAENSTGVKDILEVPADFLAKQIDAVFTDIRPDAVKVGMVYSTELIDVIADKLKEYRAEHVVVDPVFIATGGGSLLKEDAVEAFKTKLLPLAEVCTPSIPAAEILTGKTIKTPEDMIIAAAKISDTYHCDVLIKGGHNLNDANDLLYFGGDARWYYGRKIENATNMHGLGCTLSSGIAANLAKGLTLDDAVTAAKDYVSAALEGKTDQN